MKISRARTMANTYTQIYIQVIFAVKGRQNLLRRENREELHKYITGIVRNNKQKLIRINSVPDHVHILLGVKPDIALSDLVRDIKANSSRFINGKGWVKGRFNWQEGFGAFSYSHSQLDRVIKYIDQQEQHHRKESFKEEYLGLLEKFQVEGDQRFVFEWIEEE
ncbi:MAG: IS200/IS605 family transposase [Bacteroidota bacterium]